MHKLSSGHRGVKRKAPRLQGVSQRPELVGNPSPCFVLPNSIIVD